jgi:hypothetical protein
MEDKYLVEDYVDESDRICPVCGKPYWSTNVITNSPPTFKYEHRIKHESGEVSRKFCTW